VGAGILLPVFMFPRGEEVNDWVGYVLMQSSRGEGRGGEGRGGWDLG